MDPKKDTQRERGVLIIWHALFLIMIIGLTSIGVDLAKLATTQAQLQTAADAGALAGATALNPTTGLLDHDVAVTRAQTAASQNKAYQLVPTPVTVPDADVQVDGDTMVTVTARRTGDTGMVTHFAAVFLGPEMKKLDMTAVAAAVVSRSDMVCCGIIPIAAIPPSDWVPQCGQVYELKLDSGQNGGARYGFVRLPDCPNGACAGMPSGGANTFRCLLANGYCCCIQEGDQLRCETGNMDGPFHQGLLDRWNADSDQRTGICYSQYTGNMQRVVELPITTPVAGTGGNCHYTVLALASFFLVEPPRPNPNDGIRGEFIRTVNPGHGSVGHGTSYNVHLVR
jgi:Flp pilus assembly protein TadG